MVLHRKYPAVRDETELVRLSITIANLKLKEVTRKSRRYGIPLEGEDDREIQRQASGLTPEESLLRSEIDSGLVHRLQRAISGLDVTCRSLIRMQLENTPNAAIAKALNVTLDTFYVRANRCREKIRKLMTTNGGRK